MSFGQNGYCYSQQPEEAAVLDLRVYKGHQDDPMAGQLTPPRDEHCTTPPMNILSPTLAMTQKVLAAASQPQKVKARPFKAYPNDPLKLSTTQDEAYMRFREDMLSQVRGSKNPCLRKQPGSPNQSSSQSGGEGEEKDAAYWERRRRNNEAAKRSRDARRAKEDEIAIRAAFLEQENLKLRYQIAAVTEEYNHMRRAFYEARHHHTLQPIL